MKKLDFFLGFFAALLLSSCSADFDSYNKITEGKIAKVYYMENNNPYVDLKVSPDSIVEYPVRSHQDCAGRFKELRQGDKVIVYQFIKNGRPGKNFLSSQEIKPAEFETIKTADAKENTKILILVIFIVAALSLLTSLLISWFVSN